MIWYVLFLELFSWYGIFFFWSCSHGMVCFVFGTVFMVWYVLLFGTVLVVWYGMVCFWGCSYGMECFVFNFIASGTYQFNHIILSL